MTAMCRETSAADATGVAAADLRAAMRLVAGSVSVVTVGTTGNRTGATVTSAHALAVDPPTMVVAINRGSSTAAALRAQGHFCVNYLDEGQQAIARRFSGQGGISGEARYDGATWLTLASGAPVLADALAAMDCRVEEMIERHSHILVLGRVLALRSGAGRPLVYGNGRYGHFG